ncbi:type I methionyl aminopeptidase [Candidatus Gottesmanbacteria bacterium RBG_16_52_11]|uniref:Methionine aminopeptidase n=1 Tax=Candidatus Gottesmanbacteria bacterium RBG_16_52_11 TaxID=1798374 RepID=A0A1F5YXV9_9BACT|nr:MAG: type I methionyl aminopeptidase [Candidatus Gottesmanbacteria bacterium RBG_16_52_11]
MIDLKSDADVAVMSEGGKKLGLIRQKLVRMANAGTNLLDIEKQATELIRSEGGKPSFTTVEDYRWATCLCVNSEVVHGIPRNYTLKAGDVLTIDIGMIYGGFHTDTAWSLPVSGIKKNGDIPAATLSFLNTGEKILDAAIRAAKAGNRIGDISRTIQNGVESAGYSVVASLVGHGVGRKLHEEPQIPGIVREKREKTAEITPGMTLAIEVIYALGRGNVVYANDDGWTIATRDKSLSAVFEHTVAVTPAGPVILTQS